MKLKNYLKDEHLNFLRSEMRAELIEYKVDYSWEKVDAGQFLKDLQTKGIDVLLEDIEFNTDGTLEYNGSKVILYIRDAFVDPDFYHRFKRAQNKYHVAQCQTIQGFIRTGQINRYVVSTRTDGVFLVNLFNSKNRSEILVDDFESELDVCKNCLKELNYNGYKGGNKDIKTKVFDSFNIDEFFEKYKNKTLHTKTPKYNEYTSPLNRYDDEFSTLSFTYKENRNWICEGCNLDLSDNPNFLHAHHKDRQKSNNSHFNLKALCIGCHAEEPFHESMKKLPEYERFKILYKDRRK